MVARAVTKKIANPRPRGRPPKPIPMLDATPEQVARAIFSGVKPPDPSLRKKKPKSAQ